MRIRETLRVLKYLNELVLELMILIDKSGFCGRERFEYVVCLAEVVH